MHTAAYGTALFTILLRVATRDPSFGSSPNFLAFPNEVHSKELLTEGLSTLLSASPQMVNLFHPLKQAITYCLDLSYLNHAQLLLLKFLL